jgi:NAD(P)-dependent dehydrogenase (short-subunit alcohol dehydrogenase family)
VIAVDPVPERRAMAEQWAMETIDPGAVDDAASGVLHRTGRGADAVIDAVGMEAEGSKLDSILQATKIRMDRTEALRKALGSVRRGGTVSLSGVYIALAQNFPLGDLFDKQVQLRVGQANVRRWIDDLLPLVTRRRRPARHGAVDDPPPPARRGAARVRDVPEEAGRRDQGGPGAVSEQQFPPQEQEYPGLTGEMTPDPQDEMRGYVPHRPGLLEGRRALVTGGDSGIGRAVAIGFAKEGADVAIAYLSEDEDARHTCSRIEAEGRRALAIPGDLSVEENCSEAVRRTVAELGGLDILVNNIAYQSPVEQPEELTSEQWERTFRTNIFSYFWTTQAALEHLSEGDTIISTSSINGLRGNKSLIDYAATKGAINAWTYSMAQALSDRKIRVNAVAPGPVWTPLIPATMPAEKVESFGGHPPLGRAAQPDEIAPSYIFLAAPQLSGYYTGEVMAAVGGETLPGA